MTSVERVRKDKEIIGKNYKKVNDIHIKENTEMLNGKVLGKSRNREVANPETREETKLQRYKRGAEIS